MVAARGEDLAGRRTEQDYSELVAKCDSLIKAGKMDEVSALIAKLRPGQVPRDSCQGLAKICRRAGLIGFGLRLLQPIIRHEKPLPSPATAAEICEYAVLLSRNGSIPEAAGLLAGVDVETAPEALLYLSYCHISTWDYAQAAGLLEKYQELASDEYSKLIARVNLISAYLALNQLDSAENLVTETMEAAERAGALRLVGNCLELRSRLNLNRGRFSETRKDLDRALGIFGESQIYDRLFIYKWQAVMTAIETNSAEPIVNFRRQAVLSKEWESVREADLFAVKVRFGQTLLDYLTFGTPMASYRQRIQQEVGREPSASYIFGQDGSHCLDLKTGTFLGGVGKLNPGKKIHQVIAALVRDFYVPRNIGSLFSELYPREYFDINSSPVKVRQLLLRTREWLKENGLGASIVQSEGAYRFVIDGAFGVRIDLERSAVESASISWERLKSAFPGVRFTARQACSKLQWPRSSFLLIVERALKSGELIKSGTGKATAYRVSPAVQYKSAA
jgi:tetratricopeptide (TPR) repeat protein